MLTEKPRYAALSSHRFVRQIARSAGMRFAAAGLTFALVPVCIRTLGVSGFGEYAIAISWMNILVAIAKLGFDTASLRYVAQYRSQGESGLLLGFIRTSHRITWGISFLLAGCMVAGAVLFRSRMSEGLFGSMVIAAAMLPLMADIQLREARLLACGRVTAGQLGGVLLPLLVMGSIGMAAILGMARLTSPVVMLMNLGSAVIAVFVLAWLSRTVSPHVTPAPQQARVREWLTVASPLLLVQVLTLILVQSGTILCGVIIGEEAAGVFSAVARVASVLLLGLQAISMIAAPTISALYHAGGRSELERYVRRCSIASFTFAITFLVFMLLAGQRVLALLGDDVVSGFVPMIVLLVGLALAAAAGPVNHLMLMTGKHWDCIRIHSIVLITCLLAGGVAISIHGVLGAAVMAACTRVTSAFALVVCARQRHHLWCIAVPMGSTSPPVAPSTRAAA